MYEIKCFLKLAKYLKENSKKIKSYNNNKISRQSSVAVIFKLNEVVSNLNKDVNSYDNLISTLENINLEKNLNKSFFEILFIKRSQNILDPHKGEIAFPGGKCDNNEKDSETVIREVKEEIHLNLNDSSKFLYMGKIPKNFFLYFNKGKLLNSSVYLYFYKCNEDKIIKDFNKEEVEKIFWIPFSKFLGININHEIIFKEIPCEKLPNNVFIRNQYYFFIFSKFIFKNYKAKMMGSFLHKNEKIFGITLMIFTHFLKIITFKLKEDFKIKNEFKDEITQTEKTLRRIFKI